MPQRLTACRRAQGRQTKFEISTTLEHRESYEKLMYWLSYNVLKFCAVMLMRLANLVVETFDMVLNP